MEHVVNGRCSRHPDVDLYDGACLKCLDPSSETTTTVWLVPNGLHDAFRRMQTGKSITKEEGVEIFRAIRERRVAVTKDVALEKSEEAVMIESVKPEAPVDQPAPEIPPERIRPDGSTRKPFQVPQKKARKAKKAKGPLARKKARAK